MEAELTHLGPEEGPGLGGGAECAGPPRHRKRSQVGAGNTRLGLGEEPDPGFQHRDRVPRARWDRPWPPVGTKPSPQPCEAPGRRGPGPAPAWTQEEAPEARKTCQKPQHALGMARCSPWVSAARNARLSFPGRFRGSSAGHQRGQGKHLSWLPGLGTSGGGAGAGGQQDRVRETGLGGQAPILAGGGGHLAHARKTGGNPLPPGRWKDGNRRLPCSWGSRPLGKDYTGVTTQDNFRR